MTTARVKREIAEELLTDVSTALASTLKNAFPNLPLRVYLQKGRGRKLGVLVAWEGEIEEHPTITYPTIHKITRANLRPTEYGREKLRLGR